MNIPQREPDPCFHEGAFFEAIGVEFDNLDRVAWVINADALDAWFAPSPGVISALRERLPWVVRTSPPTGCEGLIDRIARPRVLPPESVLPGAGSSSLVFLSLCQWLGPSSRALILASSYGEHPHVLENVIGCRVDRFSPSRSDGFELDLDRLEAALQPGYDLVVLVNPNNPTGRHVPRKELETFLSSVFSETRFWIDEAHVDCVGTGESLERFAAGSENVAVCKSMSKVYALSRLRVGYLCGSPSVIGALRPLNPPWAVSLPGQMAAVHALQNPDYYCQRYLETHALRSRLASDLEALGNLRVLAGTANFLFLELPAGTPPSAEVMERCREQYLFLRDPAATTPSLGSRSLRMAVKDAATNRRMVEILGNALA